MARVRKGEITDLVKALYGGKLPEKEYQPPKTACSPNFFWETMSRIAEENQKGEEFAFSAAMCTICALLEELGYGEGISIFEKEFQE